MNTQMLRLKREFTDARALQSGFSLIELMIAITISLLVMLALIAVFLNVSRTNNEMARTNSQIENGRFAMQVLQADLSHAGFWGTYVPQFDNLDYSAVPADAPNAVPDPCLEYNPANWNTTYQNNLIGIPLQTVPAGNCTTVVTDQKSDTDILVVRHAANCLAGSSGTTGDCEAVNTNKLYFQSSLCSASVQAGSTSTTIRLAAGASTTNDAYNNSVIRLLSGAGAGQTRTITGYVGATRTATVNTPWDVGGTPDESTNYSMDSEDYLLGTDPAANSLTQRDCITAADVRKFISNIYYIRTFATPGDGIPTLVRSQFDLASGTLEHQEPVALIEGIEGFRVEYGIDNVSDSGAAVNYADAVAWSDPNDLTSPTNRGDGNVDTFVRCPPADTAADTSAPSTHPAATACTENELTNVVVAKVYVLARSREETPGYTDSKTYALGTTTLGPFNDGFKRHVFSTTVRLANVSGRRETP